MNKGYTTVFKFNVWFDGDEDKQERYVIAQTEKEAIAKMEEYKENLIASGYANITYSGGWVELDNVIY